MWIILLILFGTVTQCSVSKPIHIQDTVKWIYKQSWSLDDPRQLLIQKAYDVWWMDQVILIECENTNRDYKARWDHWRAVWLCQINDRFHNIPDKYYDDPMFQIQYCYDKRQAGTKFYWPWRADWPDGEKCWSYSKKYFTIYEK